MGVRKTKKASKKILNEILAKYELDASEFEELNILLFAFVQFMTAKEVRKTMEDYGIYI